MKYYRIAPTNQTVTCVVCICREKSTELNTKCINTFGQWIAEEKWERSKHKRGEEQKVNRQLRGTYKSQAIWKNPKEGMKKRKKRKKGASSFSYANRAKSWILFKRENAYAVLLELEASRIYLSDCEDQLCLIYRVEIPLLYTSVLFILTFRTISNGL